MTIETVTRLKIVMSQREYAALLQASEGTLRTPDAEARLIIRKELERRGLLPTDGAAGYPMVDEVHHER